MKLKNRVVVITGAASGIGRAAARRFAEGGAILHLVDLDGSKLEQVAIECGRLGARSMFHAADCRDREAMKRVAATVLERDAIVDVLFLDAGVGGALDPAPPVVAVARVTSHRRIDDWAASMLGLFSMPYAAIDRIRRTRGASPDEVARVAVDCVIERRGGVRLAAATGTFMWRLARLSPRLYERALSAITVPLRRTIRSGRSPGPSRLPSPG